MAESHNQKQQQISKRRYYLAAHRRVVNVQTSNSAFLIFDVLVMVFLSADTARDLVTLTFDL